MTNAQVCCPKCDPAEFGYAVLVWVTIDFAACPQCKRTFTATTNN
jgi:hypothetical protein